ncbi:MAG: PLP-dependent lyase/thiolase [Chloroflexi bacterium]|nr:MAG: PLP-dependent lyase/thiolase [Chloroflexota bacterium]HYX10437.1 2-amino-4-oxopentanoate thiolase subunit OrtB [Candidatus Acidoferrum sp.]
MMPDESYAAVMTRRTEIMRRSVGIDYERYELDGGIAFDTEALAESPPYSIEDVRQIQLRHKVGDTPLLELTRLTELVRRSAPAGKGARILVKDEAANPSGSFKARRASMCLAHAADQGFRGVIAATSGNYGAAVASQAAMYGLKALILQEVFDSAGRGQPEVLEKTRACEAYGAEVWQLTVGPELFYLHLLLLEETGYFNASLYTPYAMLGVETLGREIALECAERFGRHPAAIIATHSGGGNVTGTARGLRGAGATDTAVIGASVDLTGLHMASDRDFNRKSFTTGHTGFGFPFSVDPDRVDVPRNSARGLRYLDRYVTVTQGEVFFTTQLLADLEGMERGPAGNTSLAAALVVAREFDADELVVVQETEYTGAGKHPTAQLTLAREMGVEITVGRRNEDRPGERIVLPETVDEMDVTEVDLGRLRRSYLRRVAARAGRRPLADYEIEFLAADLNTTPDFVQVEWARSAGARQPAVPVSATGGAGG